MKKFMKSTLRGSSAIILAFAVYFSTANTYVAFAGYSTPQNVSIAKPGYGIINTASGLSVYESASINAKKLTTLPNESYVMIVGLYDGFYMVQYDNAGHYGYILKDYVDFWQTDYYLKVKNLSTNLNMRAYASTSASKVASLPPNKSFGYFYDVTSEWYCGLYGNVTGSVKSEYVTKESF